MYMSEFLLLRFVNPTKEEKKEEKKVKKEDTEGGEAKEKGAEVCNALVSYSQEFYNTRTTTTNLTYLGLTRGMHRAG